MKTIATHNGKFHADDVFSVAALSLLFQGEKLSIVRTRDRELIEKADIVVDVGTVHDPKRERFDHHQEGGAGKRENGIPYAAFGLVWKTHGEAICGSSEIAERIDRKLVSPIDADDNGLVIAKGVFPDIDPFTVSDIVSAFVPTWKEGETYDEAFGEVVLSAKQLLSRLIKREREALEARTIIEKTYRTSNDKRIIVLDGYYPWHEWIMAFPEPLFVVYPSEDKWNVGTVKITRKGFDARKPLPKEWAGKRDNELATLTGVPDAIFCHNGRFVAVAGTKKGALALAQIALSQ